MAEETQSRLQVRQLGLELGGQKLLSNLNFSAHSGSLVGLIGPNGAGKSTLLKCLAGVTQPSRGEVFLNDQLLQHWSPQARAKTLALLMQQEQPAWSVSVATLVAMGRLPHTGSVSAALAHERPLIDAALAAADINHLAERPVDCLSGGELRRVQCARLFATGANIWLADEPIAALDPLHQLQVMTLLQQQSKQGLVIAALHDLSLAARFCDRLLLLNDGELVADGSPAQVLTEANLAKVYRIKASINCDEFGVSIIAHSPIAQ